MPFLAISLGFSAAAASIFCICFYWLAFGVGVFGMMGGELENDILIKTEAMFKCNGDSECLRFGGAMVRMLNIEGAPLLSTYGIFKILSFLFITSFFIAFIFSRSKHSRFNIIEAEIFQKKLISIDSNFSNLKIKFITRKDGLSGLPYTIGKYIYFPATLLTRPLDAKFMLYHEKFHLHFLRPYEAIIFALFSPLYILTTALILPFALLVSGSVGYFALLVFPCTICIPYFILRKIKSLLYSCIETAADLYAIKYCGPPSNHIVENLELFRGNGNFPKINKLDNDYVKKQATFLEAQLRKLGFVFNFTLIPFGLLTLIVGPEMPDIFDTGMFFRISGASILISTFFAQISISKSLAVKLKIPHGSIAHIKMLWAFFIILLIFTLPMAWIIFSAKSIPVFDVDFQKAFAIIGPYILKKHASLIDFMGVIAAISSIFLAVVGNYIHTGLSDLEQQ